MPILTNYHWDPVDDCVLLETDQNANAIATYTHEPGLFGPLLSENRGGTEYYHHYDALGSTIFLTNDSGTVTDTFQYDAWGNSVAHVGSSPTPYEWVGRWGYQSDVATGCVYVRARTYLATVARWTSVDPWQGEESSPPYVAVNNSPMLSFDPSGLVTITRINLHNPKCPDTGGNIRWRFKGPDAAGYIVQKVTVNCLITDCNDKEKEKASFEYWEAWKVGRNGTNVDQMFCSPQQCTVGSYVQEGEVRFYRFKDVHAVISKWSTTGTYPNGGNGGSDCTTSPNGLPSTGEEPEFWERDGLGGTETRSGVCTWKCCPQTECQCKRGPTSASLYGFP